jgi:hypothetical protein
MLFFIILYLLYVVNILILIIENHGKNKILLARFFALHRSDCSLQDVKVIMIRQELQGLAFE